MGHHEHAACQATADGFAFGTGSFSKSAICRGSAMAFSFKKSAELFPAAIRKKKRAGFAYRRFDTAADAVRFAIEELPADSLNGAYLQVDEARFDQNGIRSLYESRDFPLPRRKSQATSAEASASKDAA
jgi:hypothetical protein